MEQKEALTEAETRTLTRQMLSANIYIFAKRYCYCDISLETICVFSKDSRVYKLAHFDCAQAVVKLEDGEQSSKTAVGNDLHKHDTLSLGQVIYLCLYGPRLDPSSNSIMISTDYEHFLSGMTTENVDIRLDARQALESPWLQDCDEDLDIDMFPVAKVECKMESNDD